MSLIVAETVNLFILNSPNIRQPSNNCLFLIRYCPFHRVEIRWLYSPTEKLERILMKINKYLTVANDFLLTVTPICISCIFACCYRDWWLTIKKIVLVNYLKMSKEVLELTCPNVIRAGSFINDLLCDSIYLNVAHILYEQLVLITLWVACNWSNGFNIALQTTIVLQRQS